MSSAPLKTFQTLRACAQCAQTLPPDRRRCGGCESVSYCNTICQREHWSKHKQACVDTDQHWADVSLEDRPLVTAGRKFLNRHFESLIFLAAKHFQQEIVKEHIELGIPVGIKTDRDYFAAWQQKSHETALIVHLREKPDTTRTNPSSGDVYYVADSAELVPLADVPGDNEKRLSLITAKELPSLFIGAVVVAAGIKRKDGSSCRVITSTFGVGNVEQFRHWTIANDAEAALVQTRKHRLRMVTHTQEQLTQARHLASALARLVLAPKDRP